MTTEMIGWAGATLFSCCAIPQCYKTWKTKKAGDLSWLFLLMWFWGEILTFIYVILNNMETGKFQLPLLANYLFNFALVVYLLIAKWKYTNQPNSILSNG